MKKDKLPGLGKIHPDFFNRHIYRKLGKPDPSVLVKPQNGVDFGVIAIGPRVMVVSTDPFFIASELGMRKAAWFAVHIIASDVAVSGIAPKYLAVDLNLPPGITEGQLVELWDTVHSECSRLGISVVTGHTARYAGCNYPMVGGATMFGTGRRSKLIIPSAKEGDAVIVSKGPAIETTGLMAAYFPDFIESFYGPAFLKRARRIFYQMSTVKDAAIAASVGGLTSMHDATECGVWGGLFEIARHSRVGMRIDLDKIIIQEEARLVCSCFGIDPYKSISEGTLLATADRRKARAIISALESEGIPASIAGEVAGRGDGIKVFTGGSSYELDHPRVDPFWAKFEEHLLKRNERKNTRLS
ncbi:MAG: AIR synthase family protein [Candidatus Omnitrophica bacterium]|nr:AIR synthase family protein [Candidatus Omnitrophota bacterium]MDD5042252.1 AIR synthase family protein [Candidatus Omnitrophota bacterium]MDD5500107.1 AIR synthase family protein [Candidatus Omnitrophota bacterium]